jgi:hypothetical protein
VAAVMAEVGLVMAEVAAVTVAAEKAEVAMGVVEPVAEKAGEKEVVVTVVVVTAEEATAGCTNKSRADEVPSQACRLRQPTLQISRLHSV